MDRPTLTLKPIDHRCEMALTDGRGLVRVTGRRTKPGALRHLAGRVLIWEISSGR
jgi:hypothetical protein